MFFFSVRLLKMEMDKLSPLPNTVKRTITEKVTTKDSVTERTIVEDVEPTNPPPNQALLTPVRIYIKVHLYLKDQYEMKE